jgi:hypothetical protein
MAISLTERYPGAIPKPTNTIHVSALRLEKRRLNLPPPSMFRKLDYKSGSCQSMGGNPSACRAALVLEK